MQKLKHFDHVFCPVGDGVYLVKCTKTGGEFSSIMLMEIRSVLVVENRLRGTENE